MPAGWEGSRPAGQQAVFVIDLFMVLPRAEEGVKEVEAVLRAEEG